MKIPYGQENILLTSETDPILLSWGIYFFPGCETIITAEIYIESQPIQFRVDGGHPSSAHCQYALDYCFIADSGDTIALDNYSEIANFKAVKRDSYNSLISIIYYKEV